MLTIRYEDLLDHPKENLTSILEYIGYNVTEEDIERAISKHPPKGHMLKHLGRFFISDLVKIEKELKELMVRFDYYIPGLSHYKRRVKNYEHNTEKLPF